jgi:sulfonate transport system permease protein
VNALRTLRGVGGLLIFLAFWELLVRSGVAHYDYLPAPSAIIANLPSMLGDREVGSETLHTVGVTLLGWAIAVAIGLVFGTLLGFSKLIRDYLLTTVELLRPIPAVALVPVGLLLFGFSVQTELLVIVIPSIWPVLVNTMQGVMLGSTQLRDVARSLRLTRAETIMKILLPGAAPLVLVGCRLSLTTALVLAIVAEMIGNPQGIGYAVVREAQALQPEAMFAYVLLTGALGVFFNAVLIGLGRILMPGEFGRFAAQGRG